MFGYYRRWGRSSQPAGMVYRPTPAYRLTKNRRAKKNQERKVAKLLRVMTGEKRVANAQGNGTVATNLGTTGDVGCFMVQGDTNGTREGQSIVIHRLEVRVSFITPQVVNVNQTGLVRFIVAIDKDVNGAVFATTDLIENPGANTSPITPLDFSGVRNQKRFVVLHDKTKTVKAQDTNNVAGGFTQEFPTQFKIVKNFKKGLRVVYNGNAGTIADILKNRIFWWACGDGNINTQPTYNVESQIIYTP